MSRRRPHEDEDGYGKYKSLIKYPHILYFRK